MGWFDKLLAMFRRSPPVAHIPSSPAAVEKLRAEKKRAEKLQRTEGGMEAVRAEKKAAKKTGSKKRRKAGMVPAAPAAKPTMEVLTVAEAERRYGEMLRAPKPAVVARRAPEVEGPPPPIPPSPADLARKAAATAERRRAKLPEFQALLSRSDALLAVPQASFRDLQTARQEFIERWTRLGGLPEDKLDELCAARDARLEQFEARMQAARAALTEIHQQNLRAKQALIDEAKALAEREEVRGLGQLLGDIRAKLRATGPVDPADADAVIAEFSAIEGSVRQREDQSRANRDRERQEALARLENLVKRAQGLLAARDAEEAAERMKSLQAEWKTVRVPGRRTEVDLAWNQFRTAADAVFARRAEARQAEAGIALGRLEAIVGEAEAFANGEATGDPDELIHKWMTAWKKVGRAPREPQQALWERLQAAFGRIRAPQAYLEQEPEDLHFRPFAALRSEE